MQRLANSPVGPLLMFFGLPAMLVAGLLQVDWQNGAPHLEVNQQKASELGQAVQDRLHNLPNRTTIEHWQQTARETWNSHVQNSPQQNYPQYPNQSPSAAPEGYPVNNFPANNSPSGWSAPSGSPYASSAPTSGVVNPHTRAPFPSTKPPSYVSTDNNSQAVVNQAWGGQQQYQQQYQSQPYPQQQYPSQQYQQYVPEAQYQQPAFPVQTPWQTR